MAINDDGYRVSGVRLGQLDCGRRCSWLMPVFGIPVANHEELPSTLDVLLRA